MERWFEKRRMNKVLDIAYRQMIVALDTINDLEKAIEAVAERKCETAKTIIARLFKTEEEVDDLRRVVFEELTKGRLPPRDREDIMKLVTNLDKVADHVKDSARNILVLVNKDLPKEIWDAYHDMAHGIVSTAAVLRESLKSLGEDNARAREMSERVEDEENRVDKKYLEIKSLLLDYGDKLNPATLILLKDLLDSMEEATDRCADTGDYIRVLTVSFKK
ncbi:hypothetical protein DRO37_05615 [Candidatus Bathyarchaeota archaeon]|nr:MAG: hypothetical protein DRO37_05615 [Candidatus Bathyarchaeota archaeon]